MQLKVRKEFEWDKVNSYKNNNPYTIAYVYPKCGDPYIVKGGADDVRGYVESYQRVPAIAHYSFFKRGIARTTITFVGNKLSTRWIHLSGYVKRGKGLMEQYLRKKSIRVYENEKLVFEKVVKRWPRCWIKELNDFV